MDLQFGSIKKYTIAHPTFGAGTAESAPTISSGGKPVIVVRFDTSPEVERIMLESAVKITACLDSPAPRKKGRKSEPKPRKKTASEPIEALPDALLIAETSPAPILPPLDAVPTEDLPDETDTVEDFAEL